jgi:hypothetical protein
MATTRGKDSSSLGKEKRVTTPPNSRTNNITKTRLKTPTTITTLHHKPSSTAAEKQVPSYLRPTLSSRPDQSLRYVKKSGPEDSPKKAASPNRRRSFDTAAAAPPPASRLQSSFSSSSPRERTVTVRSTSFSPKTTSSLKPVAERTSRSTLKAGKPQPSHPRVTKKSTTPANKKETNIASTSAKDQEDVDITESFNLHIADQDDEEFLVHEVEEIVEVKDPSENDEHSDIVEDEKVKLCDIPEVSVEKTNPLTADIEESGDILQEEKVENQPEAGDEENGSNEIHPEESFASEITVEVKEDKEEEGGEEKEIVDENKQNEEKEMVDGESEEVILKEEENVEGGGFEETKSEVAENTEISSIEEEQKVDDGAEETKPEVANSTTMSISSKRQVGLVGKKESQAYNDVIEETASKLLEKRKNKVKALVGAFETVIDKESSSK